MTPLELHAYAYHAFHKTHACAGRRSCRDRSGRL